MITWSVSATTDISSAELFDAYLDVENYHRWMPELIETKHFEMVEKTPQGVGTIWRKVLKTSPEADVLVDSRITRAERPSRIEIEKRNTIFHNGKTDLLSVNQISYIFEDLGDGQTLMTVESIDENPGILLRLTMFLAQVFNKRKEEKMLESEIEALRGYLVTP